MACMIHAINHIKDNSGLFHSYSNKTTKTNKTANKEKGAGYLKLWPVHAHVDSVIK